MTEAADPERYLRRLAEREMLESEPDRAFLSALDRVAGAFVGAHVLERAAADAVVADCAKVAAEWGRPDVGFRWVAAPPGVGPVPLAPSRFVPGPIDVDVPWGHLTLGWVRLAEGWTDMAVSGHDRTFTPTIRKGPPALRPILEVSDDRRTATTCRFSGSGDGSGAFSGTFAAKMPLASGTAWLAFHGQRVDLPAPEPAHHVVYVEPRPVTSLGLSYLWHELALWGARMCQPGLLWRPDGKTPVVEGLVVVGALDPADRELAALRWVTDTLGGVRKGADPPPSVPPSWAAMLAQHFAAPSRAAMVGSVPVGAVVGPFDGVVVAVDGIDARPDGFAIEVVVSPGTGLTRRVDGSALEWWVEDNTGSVLLGRLEDWTGPAETATDKLYGRIEFSRPLDARAQVLRIVPMTMTGRAVITVAGALGSAIVR